MHDGDEDEWPSVAATTRKIDTRCKSPGSLQFVFHARDPRAVSLTNSREFAPANPSGATACLVDSCDSMLRAKGRAPRIMHSPSFRRFFRGSKRRYIRRPNSAKVRYTAARPPRNPCPYSVSKGIFYAWKFAGEKDSKAYFHRQIEGNAGTRSPVFTLRIINRNSRQRRNSIIPRSK